MLDFGRAPLCHPFCSLLLWTEFLGTGRDRGGGVRLGGHWISAVLFTDDDVLFAPSGQDFQHLLGQFAAKCEATGIRISTFKFDWKMMACALQVRGEPLPQVEGFKYPGIFFTREGRMKREIDRQL